ncbi:MAG: class I SAM-dependent methyltransferase, partial [Acidobacteria bacterium]|nr:class I SAM-dependent methyltransferase [Acidobacteriota bacterium]
LQTVSAPQLEVSSITDLEDGPFDLIVCSHVIQHVPTAELAPLLRRLYELTAQGGTLLLAYSRAPVGCDRFGIDRIEDGVIRSLPLTREQFDAAFSGDGLPIRYFDPVSLARQAHKVGWEETWSWTYHVLDNFGVLDSYIDRDELVNDVGPLRQQLGRDMLALWHRPNQ